MKDRLFISGLALGLENETCTCANYNIDWLFAYPSTLLWAKKLVVTDKIWSVITNGSFYPGVINQKEKEFAKAIKMIFELLDSYGLIEVVNAEGIISKELENEIYLAIDNDIKKLATTFPERVTVDDDCRFLKIDGMSYCVPELWTIYASFIYSRHFDSNSLSSPTELNYFDYKFSLGANKVNELNKKVDVFQNIFELNLPNEPIGHIYLYDNAKQCLNCAHEIKCKDTYLNEIEKNVKSILEKREYDEIHQMTNVLDSIYNKKLDIDTEYLSEDVLREFNLKKRDLNTKMRNVFPKVKRWSNLTTLISIPVALAGVITSQPELIVPGASVAALGKGTEEMIKYLESKFKWVNFINKG